MGLGTVQGIPTPILASWPEEVVVRWDKFGASFDGCCNSNPARDHVSPDTLVRPSELRRPWIRAGGTASSMR